MKIYPTGFLISFTRPVFTTMEKQTGTAMIFNACYFPFIFDFQADKAYFQNRTFSQTLNKFQTSKNQYRSESSVQSLNRSLSLFIKRTFKREL